MIEKKPEEFKISCLRDIQALFPSHCKPFYAGYGNKINVSGQIVVAQFYGHTLIQLTEIDFLFFSKGCLGVPSCWHPHFPHFHNQPPRGAQARINTNFPIIVSISQVPPGLFFVCSFLYSWLSTTNLKKHVCVVLSFVRFTKIWWREAGVISKLNSSSCINF